MRLYTPDHPDYEYHGDIFHLADTTNRIVDETARNELVDAINTAQGNDVPVSIAALDAFMDAVSGQVADVTE